METYSWHYSTLHNSPCKVLEEVSLWGQRVCRVWLPNANAIVRVPHSDLEPLSTELKPEIEADRIAYVASAAKVAEVLEGSGLSGSPDVLLAPMEANVIPLPHQIHALSRAISGDRVRYLLADEVGLGKTIEAGLILRELKLRGKVRRTLVVAPKGIATQWVSEMQTHFNESFHLLLGEDIQSLQRFAGDSTRDSVWEMHDQVIVSLDSVKPMEKRRGWSAERIAAYNRSRFEDLLSAGWDLVVVDEAHRLGGSTEQVARYKLGKGLAEAAPYLLLLSATPHQGKTDAFHRLVSLLDDQAFPEMESVTRERVAPYVIRTEKRNAKDAEGRTLFKPRRTQLIPVRWEDRHHAQHNLYEAVTEYVREGYNQAMRSHQRHIGFLMVLMQRLVTSSTRAIRTTLERRLAVLEGNTNGWDSSRVDGDHSDSVTMVVNPGFSPEDWEDMDGQEQLEALADIHAAHRNEQSEVRILLDAALRCEQEGADAKAEALLDKIYALQAEEDDAELKVLVFTEFVPTQRMLQEFLEARGVSVVTLNGSMSMEERAQAQKAFRESRRVLVSTDAGGEGLNLQFAHVVFNYDIPWNPMRLEQRIGRVDRIGQRKTVRALNFVFEDSVEFRVREVLEQKLAVIFAEFGIDKTGDVLDSALAGEIFDEVFTSALLHPDQVDAVVDQTALKLREEIRQVRESSVFYGLSEQPDMLETDRMRSHPLPHWVERMTVGYLESHGGAAERKRSAWDLRWPDGHEVRKAVFNAKDAERLTDVQLLTLEDSRVRGLAMDLPLWVEGRHLPLLQITGLPESIQGVWGLFEIQLQRGGNGSSDRLRLPALRKGYVAVFLDGERKLFVPTARHIWDLLHTADIQVLGAVDPDKAAGIHPQLLAAAEDAGREVFETLRTAHQKALVRERERGETFFAARRKGIERVGLPEVRQYRMNRCTAEEQAWARELDAASEALPEIRALMMLGIGGSTDEHR